MTHLGYAAAMTKPRSTPVQTAPAGAPHETLIVPGSAYMERIPNREANLRRPEHYPVTAICQVCGGVVRREAMDPGALDWAHTGRQAGE